MFGLIHLLFTLVKISIQASIYSFILLSFLKIAFFFKKNTILEKIIDDDKNWLFGSFIIGIFLFFFSFSHWGNHGFGDSSRIPLKHSQEILNIDGYFTYLEPALNNEQIKIEIFSIKSNFLCAKEENSNYIVFNIKNSKSIKFKSIDEYEKYAIQHKLPQVKEFKDFMIHYSEYWNGWRFILLP